MGRKFPNLYTDHYEFVEKQIHIVLPIKRIQAHQFQQFIAVLPVILRQTSCRAATSPT